jgi:hypothetical protein
MVVAKIEIPHETVLPDNITADITENIEEAITSVTGLEMRGASDAMPGHVWAGLRVVEQEPCI